MNTQTPSILDRQLCVILREIVKDNTLCQCGIQQKTNLALDTVNKLVAYGREKDYLTKNENGYLLTGNGKTFLEKFRVKNAIILAAGFGTRMNPLTYHTPKGLVRVKGEPMIERLIKQLHEVGINEIIVVTGYLQRNFDYLAVKYGVRLVPNTQYAVKNNLSSILVARDYFSSTYIVCQDNYMPQNIFNLYEPQSFYICKHVEESSHEWTVETAKSGLIQKVDVGGENMLCMYGPAYVTHEFAQKFLQLADKYKDKHIAKNFFWEDILIRHLGELEMYANDQSGKILEFDSLQELAEFDDTYKNVIQNIQSNETMEKVMHNIDGLIEALGYDKVALVLSDDGYCEKLKYSYTNVSYKITWRGTPHVLRFNGTGTQNYIDRERESYYTTLASAHRLAPPSVFYCNNKIKITPFIEDAQHFQFGKHDIKKLLSLLESFQNLPAGKERCLKSEILSYEKMYAGVTLPNDYQKMRGKVFEYLYAKNGNAKYEKSIAHGDLAPFNILVKGEEMYLIDFEYSGVLSRYWDLGNLVSELDRFQKVPRHDAIDALVSADKTIDGKMVMTWSYIVDFVWACCGFARADNAELLDEYGNASFNKAKKFFLEPHDE